MCNISFIAAGYNNLEVAEYLLEHGADVNAQDKGGLIPLHNAASYGVSSGFRLLLVLKCLFLHLQVLKCDVKCVQLCRCQSYRCAVASAPACLSHFFSYVCVCIFTPCKTLKSTKVRT